MNALKNAVTYLTSQLRQIGLFITLIVIVVFFQITTAGITLAPINVSNLIVQNSYILILAVGMVMVIIAGHIDLSVGSVVAFIGAMSGVMISVWHLPWPVAVLLCLILGAVVGAWQGFWIAYFGIPAFIVTLAGMLVFRGAAQIALATSRFRSSPTSSGRSAPASFRRSAHRDTSRSRSSSGCSRAQPSWRRRPVSVSCAASTISKASRSGGSWSSSCSSWHSS